MLDIFAGVYLVWGALRGLRRAFYEEFYAVVSLLLVFFFSWSLFGIVFQVIQHMTSFLLSFCLVVILFFPIRSWLRQRFENQFGHIRSRLAGMFMGTLRVSIILLTLMTLIVSIPSTQVQHFIVGESGLGHQLQQLHTWLKPQPPAAL